MGYWWVTEVDEGFIIRWGKNNNFSHSTTHESLTFVKVDFKRSSNTENSCFLELKDIKDFTPRGNDLRALWNVYNSCKQVIIYTLFSYSYRYYLFFCEVLLHIGDFTPVREEGTCQITDDVSRLEPCECGGIGRGQHLWTVFFQPEGFWALDSTGVEGFGKGHNVHIIFQAYDT